jgi:hypothetical protein
LEECQFLIATLHYDLLQLPLQLSLNLIQILLGKVAHLYSDDVVGVNPAPSNADFAPFRSTTATSSEPVEMPPIPRLASTITI